MTRRKIANWILLAAFFLALLFSAARFSGKLIRVRVAVDYGPKGLAPVAKTLYLWGGSTVVEATKKAAATAQGFVCCDLRDVEAIGGVHCDPKNRGWWLYDLNGKKGQVFAYQCKLSEGDKVAWHYVFLKSREK